VAQELHNIQLNGNNRMISFDIKDLFVNLPVKYILRTTAFWLNRNNNDPMIIEQTLYLLKTILEQNYFQHNHQFYQPNKGITMGSPISSTLAEIYLQYLEEKYMKHYLEHKDIVYYRRYVDDLLIVYDQSRRNADKILNSINHIDNHLEFKISEEVNNTLQDLDLSISRSENNIELVIYRKPTYTDIMIHYTSNHPYDHKLAAFIFISSESLPRLLHIKQSIENGTKYSRWPRTTTFLNTSFMN
jgi:predicted lactoylglutathione lyase